VSLKREDAFEVAEEPPSPVLGDYGGPYIAPNTVFDVLQELQDSLRISVGPRNPWFQPVFEPREVIPSVGEPIRPRGPGTILQEPDRRDIPQVQTELPMWTDVGGGYYKMEGYGGVFTAEQMLGNFGIIVGGTQIGPEPDRVVTSDEDEPVSLLGDIYDVVDAGLGGVLPGGVQPQWPTGWGGPLYMDQPAPQPAPLPVPQAQGGMAPPGLPPNVAGTCAPDDPYKGWVYKRVCGQWKWVKKKYRRRKQLFTTRDASQLSSLIGIAGKSQIAKTWIASHPS